ncbi:RNA methyltransferase [Geitlerinema sp. PCC 7407]|uniref:TrmH family RNA methyltransferase n=1 Tax=Geitlerinema sp. PCC 7407 TaxID=1173025 RepID=UPI00029F9D3C|nr:RNA methyltransferase [Geitlerinema sp. PCC 7407]AFY65688.1 tRNA/rRNA methyltransferase (SpoU) [Geitlerinema sp. PCC 7407]
MLTSLQNPLVKQLRKLQRTKERHQQQQILLEGTHLLEEAIAAGYPLLTVCFTESWQARYPQLWPVVAQRTDRMELVSPAVLAAIATTVNPDGVVATIARQLPSPPDLPVQLGLVLETVQDPGNLGTIIRTAAAAGVDGLWVSEDSVDLDHPKVLRATAGQWFRLPMGVSDRLPELIEAARAEGIQTIATVPSARLSYWELDFRQPSLLLVGNEGAGLSEDLMALADHQVQIPLSAGVESLNVAIATSLVLYEAKRQREHP